MESIRLSFPVIVLTIALFGSRLVSNRAFSKPLLRHA